MTNKEAIKDLRKYMRPATSEELEAEQTYIDSISIKFKEVVYGEWIEIKSDNFPYNSYVGCSVCKKEAKQIVVGGKLYLDKWYDEYDYFKSEYCPYCGADMRGNEDEHTD